MTSAEALAQGWALHQAGKITEAERVYRRVVEQTPDDADAWCYLGMACHDGGRWQEAETAYRRALRIRPGHIIVLNNLANTLRSQQRTSEALACYDEALRRKPDYVTAYRNKGTALYWDGRTDEALQCFRRGLELAPDDAQLHKSIGIALLLQGKWDEGWREYDWRLKTPEAPLPPFPQPVWDGSSLDGKTILLYGEQGFGDTIQFIRYAARLKEKYRCRVIVSCRRAITKLLAGCPGPDAVVPREYPPPSFDVFAPLLSLPRLLEDRPETIAPPPAYVTPPPDRVAAWRDQLARYPGVRIGLVWQGSKAHQADLLRSFHVRELLPLGRLAGVSLFSLQKGDGAEQLDEVGGRLPVVPLGEQLDLTDDAFLDTAAVLANLDLLITADTAIAHVAGAMGVPVWMLVSQVPDWRWLNHGSTTPWYSSMRIFRQARIGNWSSVLDEVCRELPRFFPALQPKAPEAYRLASTGMNRLAATKHGLMLYNRRDIYIGRSLERYGEYSELENDLFRQIVRPGQVVVEAGANIGAHTLVLSELVGETGAVWAFEPQRIVFQSLCANMALNSRLNVRCRQEAVGETPGTILVPSIDYRSTNNFGGLGLGPWKHGESVPVVTIDGLELPRCDFLKADVEGMETAVLRGARDTIERYRPILYLENNVGEQSAGLIEMLRTLGYRAFRHEPPLFSPANFYGVRENVFESIVSVNMLCVHSSIKAAIQGLRPVEGLSS